MDRSVAIAIGILLLLLIIFLGARAISTTGQVASTYAQNVPAQIGGGGCGV